MVSISILILILSILIFKYWYWYFLFQKRTEILILQYFFSYQYQYFSNFLNDLVCLIGSAYLEGQVKHWACCDTNNAIKTSFLFLGLLCFVLVPIYWNIKWPHLPTYCVVHIGPRTITFVLACVKLFSIPKIAKTHTHIYFQVQSVS